MSYHSTLMRDATDMLFAVQGEAGLTLIRPGGETLAIASARIGAVEQTEELVDRGNVVKRIAVEVRQVNFPATALGTHQPNDSWSARLAGETLDWPIERVTGLGSSHVTVHLKRQLQKRLGAGKQ